MSPARPRSTRAARGFLRGSPRATACGRSRGFVRDPRGLALSLTLSVLALATSVSCASKRGVDRELLRGVYAGSAPAAEAGPTPSLEPSSSPVAQPSVASPAATARESLRGEPRRGDEIAVCGRRFHTGTPVVLWSDPGGYDAYRAEPFLASDGPRGPRYHRGRTAPGEDRATGASRIGLELDGLRRQVHQFVLHYDACGTSRECFRVLHDVRGLSVHFLLDVDGTIYQTLDLSDQAWHASEANPVSVGVEIAHPGAYPPGDPTLARWYARDPVAERPGRERLVLPARLGDGGVRTKGFVARPASAARAVGTVQGELLEQPDFTPEQYRALAHLAAALSDVLPRIRLEAPRTADGRVRTSVLEPASRAAFEGVLGHFHVSRNKLDPGPAFRWDAFLDEARRLARPVP